ncbi:SDR family NAD(P)-dependent oxidoreductase [Umezawaea tangerina]|uniref:NAD(P)-dependent dehydrogenase (Short-subunit alcohol dehydrogenase family) n=1 Tax=Umezawaea tangerina TaxID=84725 RepID=A0A2T0SE34_9PSEU|nr:SDR family NAD(P)-dependent oxidoreductase [Umezawaea tangerina]PRY31679.1 NAD(P)-dependent dehydrogenase (short-subunit alcohol dehydrogenase family) [Umezawaea tangerina]
MGGRTVVVTGASAGIGAAAARRFTDLGARVVVVGRSPGKTAAVATDVGAEAHTVDYASLADVRDLARVLAERHPVIDVLANNAGGQVRPRTVTRDGFEAIFQVNYLAPVLLTRLLLDRLAAAPDGRVITTSSSSNAVGWVDLDDLDGVHRRHSALRAYGSAKLAMILFTRELARRAAGTTVTACAFHPGIVASDMFRDGDLISVVMRSPLHRLVSVTPDRGADPLVHLATVADPLPFNGAYLHRMNRREPLGRKACDARLARELWCRTGELLGLPG